MPADAHNHHGEAWDPRGEMIKMVDESNPECGMLRNGRSIPPLTVSATQMKPLNQWTCTVCRARIGPRCECLRRCLPRMFIVGSISAAKIER